MQQQHAVLPVCVRIWNSFRKQWTGQWVTQSNSTVYLRWGVFLEVVYPMSCGLQASSPLGLDSSEQSSKCPPEKNCITAAFHSHFKPNHQFSLAQPEQAKTTVLLNTGAGVYWLHWVQAALSCRFHSTSKWFHLHKGKNHRKCCWPSSPTEGGWRRCVCNSYWMGLLWLKAAVCSQKESICPWSSLLI